MQSTALTTCIIPVYNQIRKKPTTLIIPPNQQPSKKAIRKTYYSLSSNRHCVIVCYHQSISAPAATRSGAPDALRGSNPERRSDSAPTLER